MTTAERQKWSPEQIAYFQAINTRLNKPKGVVYLGIKEIIKEAELGKLHVTYSFAPVPNLYQPTRARMQAMLTGSVLFVDGMDQRLRQKIYYSKSYVALTVQDQTTFSDLFVKIATEYHFRTDIKLRADMYDYASIFIATYQLRPDHDSVFWNPNHLKVFPYSG